MVSADPRVTAGGRRALLPALLLALAQGLAGCPLPLHTPPPRGAPAATVKLRLGHHYAPTGSAFGQLAPLHSRRLWSQIAIDERELPYRPIAGVASTWTRVQPGWRQYRIGSHFIEAYYAMVQEYYYETRYTMCNKNVCSYSSGKYSCSYQYVSCTKQERKSRLVRRLRYRTVGHCSTRSQIYMRHGVTYLLSYRYVGPGACSLTCHIQQFQADGGFRLSPCPHVQ
jgi:hypothetical protein